MDEVRERDEAMIKYMEYLVLGEDEPFNFEDFLCFIVEGKTYRMTHDMIRKRFSKFTKDNIIEKCFRSGPTFYTPKGHPLEKRGTVYPTQGTMRNSISNIGNNNTTNSLLYNLIKELPFNKAALHDIHLYTEVPDIWNTLSLNSAYRIDPSNKEIKLPPIVLLDYDLYIRVAVQHKDSISIVTQCSYQPIIYDIYGVIRLSSALTLVRERLSWWIKESITTDNVINSNSNTATLELQKSEPKSKSNSNSNSKVDLRIPHFNNWIVKMWHFGRDGSMCYNGPLFEVEFKTAEEVLIRVYTKLMKDKKSIIRIEEQQTPNKELGELIHDRLENG